MTRRRRSRAKWRRRLARRLGIAIPPLRSLPAIQRQYLLVCRTRKKTPGRTGARVIWAPWPGKFGRD